MIQTQWTIQRLHQQWPDLEIHVVQIHTTGDRITDRPLTQIGGDGVFVTEIERALQERRIDLAVHSLKDLPTMQPEGLRVIVPGPREDMRDILVAAPEFQGGLLPGKGGSSPRIGTCSLRRTAQIRALFPDVQILPLRGNVDTRLRKLESGAYDGIVLAAAGIHRSGAHMQPVLNDRLTYFPLDVMLPAPGQGALGLECRNEKEMLAVLAPLQDQQVQATTAAERMFMRRLGAGCYLPVAAYGEIFDDTLRVRGLVIDLSGEHDIRVELSQPWTAQSTQVDAEQLGIRLAEMALEQGAEQIIMALQTTPVQERSHV